MLTTDFYQCAACEIRVEIDRALLLLLLLLTLQPPSRLSIHDLHNMNECS
jgi:hypothetical protein